MSPFKFWRRGSSDKPAEVAFTVSNTTLIRVFVAVVLFLLFLAAIKHLATGIVLIVVAFFLALALNAPVNWISRHLPKRWRGKRIIATALVFLIGILIVGGLAASVVPSLASQIQTFIAKVPALIAHWQHGEGQVSEFIRQHHIVSTFSDKLNSFVAHFGGSSFEIARHIVTSVVELLTTLVLTFMMLVEGPKWIAILKNLLPPRRKKHVVRVCRDMYAVIRGYVNGQLILALIAGGLMLPMLLILHVSFPVVLAALVFIAALIPLVGHTIGAIIVTGVALFHSPVSAIIVLAYYILYINIENYVIQPRIQSSTTNLSPLLVFAAVVLGIEFSGLLGGLLAIPVMGCIRVLVLDFIHRRKLMHGEDAPSDGDIPEPLPPASADTN
jgi:predicted PurR-regulated permease PerM